MITKIPEAIQAAQIQADATFNAAIFSTIAIVIGLFVSYLTAKRIQRNTSIDELRRTTYLNTVETFSRFIATLSMVSHNPKKCSEEFYQIAKDFFISLDNTMFVCSTNTKVKIVEFYEIFFLEYDLIKNDIHEVFQLNDDLELTYQSHSKALGELEPIKVHLTELQIKDPLDIKIRSALDLMEARIIFAEKYRDDASKIEQQLKSECLLFSEKYDHFEKKIRPKANNVMYFLRQEIGIPTDKILDKNLNDRINTLLS